MRKDAFNSRNFRNGMRAQSAGSQFNASHKRERHSDPPQFAGNEVEEIRNSSEYRDARANAQSGGRSSQRSGSGSSSARGNSAGSSTGASASGAVSNIATTVVQQAVVMVAGAAVVTNSYTAMVEEREERAAVRERTLAIEAAAAESGLDIESLEEGEAVWVWEEDRESAMLLIPGVGVADAEVTVEEEPPGCVTPGLRIYTATAVIGEETYTDAQEEEIPPTGHSFGEPQVTTDADGNPVISVHCDGCDQDFELRYNTEKEE